VNLTLTKEVYNYKYNRAILPNKYFTKKGEVLKNKNGQYCPINHSLTEVKYEKE